jgi:hypothetical protein
MRPERGHRGMGINFADFITANDVTLTLLYQSPGAST